MIKQCEQKKYKFRKILNRSNHQVEIMVLGTIWHAGQYYFTNTKHRLTIETCLHFMNNVFKSVWCLFYPNFFFERTLALIKIVFLLSLTKGGQNLALYDVWAFKISLSSETYHSLRCNCCYSCNKLLSKLSPRPVLTTS